MIKRNGIRKTACSLNAKDSPTKIRHPLLLPRKKKYRANKSREV
jgi:hypothetical protein